VKGTGGKVGQKNRATVHLEGWMISGQETLLLGSSSLANHGG